MNKLNGQLVLSNCSRVSVDCCTNDVEKTVQFLLRDRVSKECSSTCHDNCNVHILNTAEQSLRILPNDKPMAAVNCVV